MAAYISPPSHPWLLVAVGVAGFGVCAAFVRYDGGCMPVCVFESFVSSNHASCDSAELTLALHDAVRHRSHDRLRLQRCRSVQNGGRHRSYWVQLCMCGLVQVPSCVFQLWGAYTDSDKHPVHAPEHKDTNTHKHALTHKHAHTH